MLRARLIDNLQDLDYRRHFVDAQVRRSVSEQIRSLREEKHRGWTQADLGKRAGMKANAISRLENPNYGDFSINTLLRLSDAFDIGLIVRYVSISDLVDWNQNVSQKSYIPPSFSEDARLFEIPKSPNSYVQETQSFYRSERRIYPVFIDMKATSYTVGNPVTPQIIIPSIQTEDAKWREEKTMLLWSIGKNQNLSQQPSQ